MKISKLKKEIAVLVNGGYYNIPTRDILEAIISEFGTGEEIIFKNSEDGLKYSIIVSPISK